MTTRLWLIILSLISNVLALALPLALIQVYDRILANQAVGTAIVIFSAVALAILLDGIVKYARTATLGRLAAEAEYRLSLKTAEKLLTIDQEKLKQFRPGRIRELFAAINKSNDVLVGQSTLALFDAPFAISFLILVWFLGGPTVLGPLFVLIVFGAFALFCAARQARAGLNLFEASADQASLIMTRREELDQIIERGHLGEFAGNVRRYEKRRAAAQEIAESNLAAALNLSQTGGLATTVSVLGIGSLVVLAGDMTTGGLAACLILGQRGVAGLLGLINALARRQVSASALKSIQSLLSHTSASSLEAQVRPTDASVGLRFQVGQETCEARAGHCLVIRSQYTDQRDRVFQALAQTLEQGKGDPRKQVAVVEVFTSDGVSVSARGCHVTVCDANPKVFNGTVLENMTAFDAEATDRAMFYSEHIGLSEAIGRLRDGVETLLSPGLGIPFSDGHAKRLMLVRALSGTPQLLLLNRPSQYLDAAGISQLAGLLKSLDGKTTVIAFDGADAFTSQFEEVFELPDLPADREVAA
ncbi:ABC transporter transmembrane domain-containing protein [Roseibium sp.]|uniref:ABC transporter transmembrane domain-containing protein n=1 Tax=Roseibium sp. TaxID=1936156 RepID=UPI00391D2062